MLHSYYSSEEGKVANPFHDKSYAGWRVLAGKIQDISLFLLYGICIVTEKDFPEAKLKYHDQLH